jgi:hypothetical protein
VKRFRILFIILSLSTSAVVRSDIVLDQHHTFTSSIANSTNGDVSQMGQTFTVGVAGTLDHIDVLMFRLGGIFDPTGDPVMRIFNTAGGFPNGSPLALVTIPKVNVPLNVAAMVTFDVSSAGIVVNPGDILAFSITAAAGTGPYFLLTDQGQAIEYNGGAGIAKFGANPWQLFNPPDQDHGFRTFVNSVPEPASIPLLLLSGFAMVCRRRR